MNLELDIRQKTDLPEFDLNSKKENCFRFSFEYNGNNFDVIFFRQESENFGADYDIHIELKGKTMLIGSLEIKKENKYLEKNETMIAGTTIYRYDNNDLPRGMGIKVYRELLKLIKLYSLRHRVIHVATRKPPDGNIQRWNKIFRPILEPLGYDGDFDDPANETFTKIYG